MALALLLFMGAPPRSHAAGIKTKGLAVDLNPVGLTTDTFASINVQSFSVVNGVVVANAVIVWYDINDLTSPVELGTTQVQLPLLDVQGDCDTLSITLSGSTFDSSGTPLSFDSADFVVHSGSVTPTPVRQLLCVAGRLADLGVNPIALAGALNRMLPAIQ